MHETKSWKFQFLSRGLPIVAGILFLLLPAGKLGTTVVAPHTRETGAKEKALVASERLSKTYGKLPLSFEANRGQIDPSVQFVAQGHKQALLLKSSQAVLILQKRSSLASDDQADFSHDISPLGLLLPESLGMEVQNQAKHFGGSADTAVLSMTLVGSRSGLRGMGADELPGKTNYFVGNDPASWKTNIDTYAKVKYQGVYPGIDLVYYGNQQQLEYDFVVHPGSDPRLIKMDLQGADAMRLDSSSGDLVLSSAAEKFVFKSLLCTNSVADRRQLAAKSQSIS